MSDNVSAHASQKPLAITIMGPTASGKTDLAIALQDRINASIISVDSALVYRGMDIGSAKPTVEELRHAPHRMIDIRDPSEPYSAADFCSDAKQHIREVVDEGKVPLLVGGTMMYFKSLLEGLSDLPESSPEIRHHIEQIADKRGWQEVHRLLSECDPQSAQQIHPNHSQRLSRAYEVFLITGKPMSQYHGKLKGGLLNDFDWVQIAIAPRERKLLHQRIEKRFHKMLELGVVGEVETLKQRGDLHNDLPAIRAVGYRQIWDYLDGKFDYAEMVDKGIVATRQLAKRQLTWLRSWENLNWIYTQDESNTSLSSEDILKKALNFLENRPI